MTSLELLGLASMLVAFSGLPGLLLPAGSTAAQRIATFLHVLGCAAGTGAAAWALAGGMHTARFAWPLPGGFVTFALDRLSAFFLVPVFVVSGLGSIYGEGYWEESRHPENGRKLRVLLRHRDGQPRARDGRRGCLELSRRLGDRQRSRRSSSSRPTRTTPGRCVRDGSTSSSAHAGTLVLFAMFALLRDATGGWLLVPSEALGASRAASRPSSFSRSSASASRPASSRSTSGCRRRMQRRPSHVSALLSGVVLKMGIYGLVRVLVHAAGVPDVARPRARRRSGSSPAFSASSSRSRSTTSSACSRTTASRTSASS